MPKRKTPTPPRTEDLRVVETFVPREKIRNTKSTGFELAIAFVARRIAPVLTAHGVDLDRDTTIRITSTPGGDVQIRVEGIIP